MKLSSKLTVALLLAGSAASLPAQEATTPPLSAPTVQAPKFSEEQVLEAFGWFVGRRMGLSELDFNEAQIATIVKGLMTAAGGKDAPYKIEDIGPELDKFMQAKQQVYNTKQKAKSQGENDKFFASLKGKEGIITLPSGLMYEIVKKGEGDFPKASDTVKVHYTGTLVNGTKFDSSVDRGEPAEFPLTGVIAGWTEGLQKIQKGGKIKLYVPFNLAYGEEGRPPTIPPAATLIFDVELLEIKPTPAAPAEAATPPVAVPTAAPGGM